MVSGTARRSRSISKAAGSQPRKSAGRSSPLSPAWPARTPARAPRPL